MVLDDVLNGADKSGWGGFNNLFAQIGKVIQ
jgi:hypothetical protein